MKNKRNLILSLCILLALAGCSEKSEYVEESYEINPVSVETIQSNELSDFDLIFLQMHTENENKVYSPISMKYALSMLRDASANETREQIENILGSYEAKRYQSNEHFSFANALFIKESKKNTIKNDYIDAVQNKYDAEVIFDSFDSPDAINNWVSEKTFQMIDHLVDDVSQQEFYLVNALAIDMEWINPMMKDYSFDVGYNHLNNVYLGVHKDSYVEFGDMKQTVQALGLGASINKYDLVNTLGEANIREELASAYKEWLLEWEPVLKEYDMEILSVDAMVDKYINELNENYKRFATSTDFSFSDTETEKVFVKDLKEYDGLNLEYIAIMPKKESLQDYISELSASDVNELVNDAMSVTYDNFEEGYITIIEGKLPVYKFDYSLNLKQDFRNLGIIDAFDLKKADLSVLATDKKLIHNAIQKATIEFSNEGIKASAATSMGGGMGADGPEFTYYFDAPVIRIDLTFDQPFVFLIRDKNTNEVWFVGTVYNPTTGKWDYSSLYN